MGISSQVKPTILRIEAGCEELPLITVITVVFNSEQFLEETILSVINQTHPNIEYIIIDGGSTDGTLNIIHKYERAINYWVSEKDRGIYDAMNKAVRYANGRWVTFINSGDIWLRSEEFPELCEMLNKENYNVILCNSRVSRGSKQTTYIKTPIFPLKKSAFIFGIPACHQGIIYRRTQMIPFDTCYKVIADKVNLWKLFSRKDGNDFAHYNHVVSEYRLGGFSEINRKRYQQEEARFFSEAYSLGDVGYFSAHCYLKLKRKIFVLLTYLRIND